MVNVPTFVRVIDESVDNCGSAIAVNLAENAVSVPPPWKLIVPVTV